MIKAILIMSVFLCACCLGLEDEQQYQLPIFKNVQLVNNSTGNVLAFRSQLKSGQVFVAMDTQAENQEEDTLFDAIPSEDESKFGAYTIKHVKSELCLQVESKDRKMVFGNCDSAAAADQLVPFALVGGRGEEWMVGDISLVQNIYFNIYEEATAESKVISHNAFRMVKRD